jgi:nitroreductase/NAD-dependent dihydropyrimidine dehydrogenase PreA subunit
MSLFTIDPKKCRRDGLCVAECPAKIIEIIDEDGFPTPVPGAEELCINCGHCVAVCPHSALTLQTMGPQDCLPVRKELLLSPEHCEHFLRSRRSLRNYKEKPVPHTLLQKLLEVVRHAPTGHNSQPVHWLVIEKREEVNRLAGLVADWMRWMLKENGEYAHMMHFDRVVEAYDQGIDRILRGAPHLIVAHGLSTLPASQPACIIALTYLELAAPSFDLGTCWGGYFNAAANNYPPLKEALALPKDHLPYGAAMIGYPKFSYPRMPPRNAPNITWRS